MMLSFAKYFQNLTGTKDWQTKKSRYSTKQRPAKLLKHFSKAFFSRICIANACVLFALVAVVAAAAAVAAAAVAAAAVAAVVVAAATADSLNLCNRAAHRQILTSLFRVKNEQLKHMTYATT